MRSRSCIWFETGVRYRKTQEDGSEKAVTEKYVVDALSFTEAESAIIDEMSVYVSGELKVKSVVQASYGEVFFSDNNDDDKWYKAKLQFITIDEKNEKEKRTNVTYLIQAKSMTRALCNIDEAMGKTMTDYKVVSLNETKIVDVFIHQTEKSKKQKSNEEKEEE